MAYAISSTLVLEEVNPEIEICTTGIKLSLNHMTVHENDLDGHLALVTGGSGDIGSAIVLALARRGADVVIHYNHKEHRAKAICNDVLSLGNRCLIVQGDLTQVEDIDKVIHQTSKLGPIDILINNAGTPIRRVHWIETRADHLDQVFALNYRAPLFLIQHLAPSMIERGRGVIINIISVAAHTGGTETVLAYGSAKGALLTLTRGLARYLAPKGVRVLAISPGTIDTEIQRSLTNQDLLGQLVNSIPLGRMGQPAEVGEVVAFMATDQASFVVGATIEVNGGIYM
jgi:3-oxoacyl-[acyl-carrier protein] reductase